MQTKTIFFALLILTSTIGCFSKTRKSECMISHASIVFLGIDTTSARPMFSGRKECVVWEKEIKTSSTLAEFANYTHWKKAAQFKCIPNARIILVSPNSNSMVLEANISSDCAFVKYNVGDTPIYKQIPQKILQELLEYYKQVPKKNGFIQL